MFEDSDPVQRLVEQIQAGVKPEESFRGIFQLNHARVEAFFLRKGFPREVSQELVQETFLRVFQALPSFGHHSSFLVWLFGIMNHVYLNELRRRRSNKRDGLELSIDMPGSEGRPPQQLAAVGEDPLARSIASERSQALLAALAELPEQMRLCCILRYQESYKYQEIARLMGISIETVKAHLHQARKRLTAKLGGTDLS